MLLMVADLIQRFREVFPENKSPVGIACAPGRANVIGEHTDYQEGFVTPFALEQKCHVVFAQRTDKILRCYSNEYKECDLTQVDRAAPPKGWIRYVAGAFEFVGAPGADILISSDVPMGAGVSSSSALTVASVIAAAELTGPVDLLKTACEAEWCYSGVKGGIMDQFASLHGQQGRAFVLDCRSLQVTYIDLDVDFLLLNTNVKHSLVDSPYSKRRESCERVARMAGKPMLRDMTLDDLPSGITDEDRMRATHGILENARVMTAIQLSKDKDWVQFGALLNEAHASLRDLYQVSCPELDRAQEIAKTAPDCYGARMMGGGFGGSVIALCKKGHASDVADFVLKQYPELTPLIATPGPGAAVFKDGLFVPAIDLYK